MLLELCGLIFVPKTPLCSAKLYQPSNSTDARLWGWIKLASLQWLWFLQKDERVLCVFPLQKITICLFGIWGWILFGKGSSPFYWCFTGYFQKWILSCSPNVLPAAMDWGSGTLWLDGGCIRSNHRRILIPTETKMKRPVAQFLKSSSRLKSTNGKRKKGSERTGFPFCFCYVKTPMTILTILGT
jgi:hypothetical protein